MPNKGKSTGVTAPEGFQASGLNCGIKKERSDLGLLYSDTLCPAAGVFTKNVVKAAPVLYTSKNVKSGYLQAIVVNSGNANACTGDRGLEDAEKMASITAEQLGIKVDAVGVASTGLIGMPLPMDKISSGIKEASKILSGQSGYQAAEAIMTTDTFVKESTVEIEIDDAAVTLGGMAKGSGMINPNMATMLAFITTDINISPAMLNNALKWAADRSFNTITVDGDTSTNDMVLTMASGRAGNMLIDSETDSFYKFREALYSICTELAKLIVRDGEGASKFIEIEVKNFSAEQDARRIAKSIANSKLFKTALFGEDANWGRILAAAGYSGANFDPQKVDIYLESSVGKEKMAENGMGLNFSEDNAGAILKEKDVRVILDMKQGEAKAYCWTCDLSYEYIRINAEYRT